jgi:hypothetical protein
MFNFLKLVLESTFFDDLKNFNDYYQKLKTGGAGQKDNKKLDCLQNKYFRQQFDP